MGGGDNPYGSALPSYGSPLSNYGNPLQNYGSPLPDYGSPLARLKVQDPNNPFAGRDEFGRYPQPMLHRGDNFFNGGTPLQNPEQVYGGGGLGSNPDLNDTYKYQLLSAGKMFGGPSGAGGFNLF